MSAFGTAITTAANPLRNFSTNSGSSARMRRAKASPNAESARGTLWEASSGSPR
jgi:hypothetical protein